MSAKASLAELNEVTTAPGFPGVASAASTWGEPDAGRVLPTRAELATVLPWSGLRHGSTVAVYGSTALLFALLSEATSAGSWAAAVGLPALGLVAAAESGVEVSRLALVQRPGADTVNVLAALLDGVDLVAIGDSCRVSESDARRLSARARHRGSVLLPCGNWPGADVRLRCTEARWRGLSRRDQPGGSDGHGHLREREITIRAEGRGAASRPRSCRLLLPGPGGGVADPPTSAPARPVLRPVAG